MTYDMPISELMAVNVNLNFLGGGTHLAPYKS